MDCTRFGIGWRGGLGLAGVTEQTSPASGFGCHPHTTSNFHYVGTGSSAYADSAGLPGDEHPSPADRNASTTYSNPIANGYAFATYSAPCTTDGNARSDAGTASSTA